MVCSARARAPGAPCWPPLSLFSACRDSGVTQPAALATCRAPAHSYCSRHGEREGGREGAVLRQASPQAKREKRGLQCEYVKAAASHSQHPSHPLPRHDRRERRARTGVRGGRRPSSVGVGTRALHPNTCLAAGAIDVLQESALRLKDEGALGRCSETHCYSRAAPCGRAKGRRRDCAKADSKGPKQADRAQWSDQTTARGPAAQARWRLAADRLQALSSLVP